MKFFHSLKSISAFFEAQKSPAISISTLPFPVNKIQNFVIRGKNREEMHGSRTLLRMKVVLTGDNDTSCYHTGPFIESVPSAERAREITEYSRRKLPFP